MKRIFTTLFAFLVFTLSVYAQPRELVVLNVSVDSVAVQSNTADLFAEEGIKLDKEVTATTIYPLKKKTYYNKYATKENCLSGLKWVASTATEDSLAFIYIGTHGADRKGFYSYLADGVLSTFEIKNALSGLVSPTFFVMDACQSGAFIRDWGEPKNVFMIAACREDELAYVWGLVDPFRAALRVADYDRDGYIDTREISDYVLERARGQHPVTSNNYFRVNFAKAR